MTPAPTGIGAPDPRGSRRRRSGCAERRRRRHPARSPARARQAPRHAGDVGSGVRGRGRLHRSRQLRDQYPGWRQVRLCAAVGRAARQPDGDAGAVPLGQAGGGHVSESPRAVPRAPSTVDERRPVGSGGGHGDGDRCRRVSGRGARFEFAVWRSAFHRRAHHRGDRVCDPRASAARRAPVRAGDHGVARNRVRRVPVRDAEDRPLSTRGARRFPPSPRRQHVPVPRRRDHRSNRHAARDLSPLGADEPPDAAVQRPRAEPCAEVPATRRDDRARARRRDQHRDARRGGQTAAHAGAFGREHDPGGPSRAGTGRRRQRRARVRSRAAGLGSVFLERRDIRGPGGHGRVRQHPRAASHQARW